MDTYLKKRLRVLQDRGRCRDSDQPDRWFPESRADLARAKSVCAACPLKRECLTVGTRLKFWGVWGGVLLADGVERKWVFQSEEQEGKRKRPESLVPVFAELAALG